MAVTAFNENMNFTLASESFFDAYWSAGIQNMNLPLLAPLMHKLHVKVTADNWTQLEQELQIMYQWAAENVPQPQGGFIMSRVQQLLEMLPYIFNNEEASLMIAP